jgi:hypothetical protein
MCKTAVLRRRFACPDRDLGEKFDTPLTHIQDVVFVRYRPSLILSHYIGKCEADDGRLQYKM